MRKVKLAYRFPDLETATRFSNDNKLIIDEVILLFDTLVEQDQAQEIPEHTVDKDKVIEEQQKEIQRLKGSKEMPKPPAPKKPDIRIIQI